MPKEFVWDPFGNQSYSSEYGSQELKAPYFSKAPQPAEPCGFTMDAPGQTLTLVPTEASAWGTTHDVTLPPVRIALRHGSLLMRGVADPRDLPGFAMGPFMFKANLGNPTVVFTIADAAFELSSFGTVKAGGFGPRREGFPPEINLDLSLSGTGRYHVDCLKYLSAKKLSIADRSTVKVRAQEIVLRNSKYSILAAPAPVKEPLSLYMESTGGEMEVADSAMLFHEAAAASVKSKQITFLGNVEITAEDSATVTFTSDHIAFHDGTTAVFSIEGGDANFIFQSESGGLPFDFLERAEKYPEGLFNLQTPSKGKIILYGIGNAFEKASMMHKKIVAVNGVPQSNDTKVNYEYRPNSSNSSIRDLVLSLK